MKLHYLLAHLSQLPPDTEVVICEYLEDGDVEYTPAKYRDFFYDKNTRQVIVAS